MRLLLIIFVVISSTVYAAEDTKCKIYGNCSDSPRAAEKSADLDKQEDDLGKNVEIEIKLPPADYLKNDKLSDSEISVGTVKVDTAPGEISKCNYSHLIGKKLDEVSLPPHSRVLHEGDQITMEYMENRVNIILNASDIIVNISCG